jgi:hypothetical protein
LTMKLDVKENHVQMMHIVGNIDIYRENHMRKIKVVMNLCKNNFIIF